MSYFVSTARLDLDVDGTGAHEQPGVIDPGAFMSTLAGSERGAARHPPHRAVIL